MPRPRPLADRFWDKVDRQGGEECWPWKGARLRQGYGHIMLTRSPDRRLRAHRVAWELHYGPIPDGLVVMHTCDNPPCVNPAHLRIGTIGDNNRDRSNKGRGRENRQSGTDNPNAKLQESDVREIIAALREGETQMAIASRFGVKQPQVSRIARRVQWAHLWEE